jgi:uncharacterized protein YcnI
VRNWSRSFSRRSDATIPQSTRRKGPQPAANRLGEQALDLGEGNAVTQRKTIGRAGKAADPQLVDFAGCGSARGGEAELGDGSRDARMGRIRRGMNRKGALRMLRRLIPGAMVVGIVACSASTAWARVTVTSETATQGANDVEISFRVSNEEPVNTTKVQVFIPSHPAIASAFAQSVPGWTTNVVTEHLSTPIPTDNGPVSDIVTQIAWTANSAESAVESGDFQEFKVLMGPLPYTNQIVFKAFQTYSNGDVVRWVDTQSQGSPVSGVPAPVLRLTPATAPPSAAPSAAADAALITRLDAQIEAAHTVAVIGTAIGTLGLILAVLAFMSRRRAA